MIGSSAPEPQAPNLAELAEAIVAELVSPKVLEKLRKHAQETHLAQAKDIAELGWQATGAAVEGLVTKIIEWTSLPPLIGRALGRAAIDTLLEEGGANLGDGAELGRRIIARLSGAGGPLAPGYEAAAAYMGLLLSEQVEAWARSVFGEFASGQLPAIAGVVGGIESFQGLQDIAETALGGQRMVRRVLQPILQASAITPAQWQANKTYRPELLAPAEAIRQFHRGRLTREQLLEELARQGWSDERIDHLVASGRRYFGAGDVRTFVARKHWTNDQGLQHLRDQGYDQVAATDALRLEGLRRIDQLEGTEAALIIAAYADRRIDRSEFGALMTQFVTDATERTLLTELAELRRSLIRRNLSAGEARRLAQKRILSVPDYRRALRDEGYDEFAVAALELELMQELQEQRDLEELRAEQRAEREAEKAQREEERLARQLELQQKRARAYGSLQEARRLYVRGFVPIDAYRDALEAERLPNLNVAAYLADAEADRADYLEVLERKAEVEGRERDVVVPIGQIEQAVLRGIIALVDYDRELAGRGFDESERRMLVNLLADRLEDQAAAEEAREAARRRAELAGVSLQTYERAVRLGVRTTAQYAAFLTEIGTAPPAAALILDLLTEQLRRDAEAQAARDQAAAAAARNGISLEQRARAVRAGVRPLEYYAAALADTDLPIADQQVLVELLDVEAQAAAEARARRAEIPDQAPGEELSLSTIERAVRLGALPPTELRQRAIARGLSDADADLLVQLVVADVPATRQAQQRERSIVQELAARGISYADEKALVKRGIRSLEQHAAWLADQRYGADDVALLVQLLEEELAADLDGLRKRIAAKLEREDGAPAIDAFVTALRAGELDALAFRDALASWNVGRDEALIFGRLLLVIEPSA